MQLKNKEIKEYGLPILGIAGLAAAFCIGKSYDNYCVARALKAYHELGYFKFFDPKKGGIEIGVKDICEVIKRDGDRIRNHITRGK